MSTCYDLHSHTYHSDGTLSPSELVLRAKAQQVNVLALTDHDVTDGLQEATATARDAGLTLVPGVEISATWAGRTIHIIGLHIDPDNSELQQGLAALRDQRNERALVIDQRLQKKGITDTHAGASALAQGAILSRTHFARHLVEAGHAKDISQAFKRYLADGKSAGVASQWASLEQACRWINAAGGQAVLAHPGRYKLGSTKLRSLLGDFQQTGGVAIEVISGSQSPQDSQRFARLAQEYDLLASVGSDYHGPDKPWVELGRLPALPPACTPVWHQW